MLSSAIDQTAAVPAGFSNFDPLKVRAIKRETRDAVTITFDVPRE